MRVALKKSYLVATALLMGVVAIGGKAYRDSRFEIGYIAFNTGEYTEARDALSLIAELGDPRAQQLMAYISGLGLAGPVDVVDAMNWFEKKAPHGVSAREYVGERAYYMGKDAIDGRYGAAKVELGRVWLQIADVSGSTRARLELRAVEQ